MVRWGIEPNKGRTEFIVFLFIGMFWSLSECCYESYNVLCGQQLIMSISTILCVPCVRKYIRICVYAYMESVVIENFFVRESIYKI